VSRWVREPGELSRAQRNGSLAIRLRRRYRFERYRKVETKILLAACKVKSIFLPLFGVFMARNTAEILNDLDAWPREVMHHESGQNYRVLAIILGMNEDGSDLWVMASFSWAHGAKIERWGIAGLRVTIPDFGSAHSCPFDSNSLNNWVAES